MAGPEVDNLSDEMEGVQRHAVRAVLHRLLGAVEVAGATGESPASEGRGV